MRINVGLAMPDRDEMVYLESVRYNRRVALRNVVAGQRVPMELTSLGRAYLAMAPSERRATLLAHFAARRGGEWRRLKADIETARQCVERHGYCIASWQPDVVALATPLITPGRPVYVLNASVTSTAAIAEIERELREPLLTLRAQAVAALAAGRSS
jgi:DNA-binding IclR family transcriptional regulator